MTPDLERLCAYIYNRLKSDPPSYPRIMDAVMAGWKAGKEMTDEKP